MMYAKSAVTATISMATVERAPRFRDRRRHLLAPSLFLTLEDAAGDLDESPGAVQRKPFAPRLRHVREVLGGEHPSRGASLRAGQLVHADASHNVGEQVRGVPDWIAQGDRIEVDEHHSLTAQEHVVGATTVAGRVSEGAQQAERLLSAVVAIHLQVAPHGGLLAGDAIAGINGVPQRGAELRPVPRGLDGPPEHLPRARSPPRLQALQELRLEVA